MRVDVAYPKQGRWTELDAKLVRYFCLPNGSKFRIKRLGGASSRLSLRPDVTVRRKLFKQNDHPRDDGVLVGDIYDRLEAMLAPSDRAPIVGYAPDGKTVDRRCVLKTWRAKTPKLSPAQRAAKTELEEEIDWLTDMAWPMIGDFEEGVWDAEDKVPHAVIRSLCDRYGVGVIQNAIKALRIC